MSQKKKPDYEACWKELEETVLAAAWEPRCVQYEATSLLELLSQLVEKHGGPSFDEQVYGVRP